MEGLTGWVVKYPGLFLARKKGTHKSLRESGAGGAIDVWAGGVLPRQCRVEEKGLSRVESENGNARERT
jgi:hypothetical protein